MKLLFTAILLMLFHPSSSRAVASSGTAPHSANPILPGYYADPSVVQFEGKAYIYVTLDPWGGETLGCWESYDFKNWTFRELNWPTKATCTSEHSGSAAVWAPSVIHGPDGRFHMAISVGNEVWIGVADNPLGPWRNALGDRPLISYKFRPGFHMIDAEYFVDGDGRTYLYWGSGWNWKNGRCWAAKLTTDLSAFDGEVRDVTPEHYFEGPIMVKRHGHYFLMYSNGNTTKDTYQVHYAVGDSPTGPFTEADNSPILTTDTSSNIISPGHHTVFQREGRDYILYHRHSIPFVPEVVGRQTCVDSLVFTADGRIETVVPSHPGPALVQGRAESKSLASTAVATASGQLNDTTAPAGAFDDNYATRWAAADIPGEAWLQLDFGASKKITRQLIRPEYAWKKYRFMVQSSVDGKSWKTLADFTENPASGSPILVEQPCTARYLRLLFPADKNAAKAAVLEWAILNVKHP